LISSTQYKHNNDMGKMILSKSKECEFILL